MNINSVDQNTINVVLQNAKVKETEKTEEVSSTLTADTAASGTNTDTLELSSSAQSYLSTETETSTSALQTSSADEDEDTDELYTYTESELAELLANGDITQSEYDAELARRGIEV